MMMKLYKYAVKALIVTLILCGLSATTVYGADDFQLSKFLYEPTGKVYVNLKTYVEPNYKIYIARYDISGAAPMLIDFRLDTMQGPKNQVVDGVEKQCWETSVDILQKNEKHEIRYMIWDAEKPLQPITKMFRINRDTEVDTDFPEEIG